MRPHDPLIVDVHTHTFPRLGSASGAESAKFHTSCIQHHVQYHTQGIRRVGDDAPVGDYLLAPDGDGIDSLRDVNFRVAHHGRIEFTVGGEDYYVQWYPLWMADMAALPQLMISYMNYVGVDIGVLQHDHVYGALDDYLTDVVRQYPDRFIALAQIREWEADQEKQLERLRHQVQDLGHRGLYYSAEGFAHVNYESNLADPRWEPMWDLVRELAIPVFWYLHTPRRNRFAAYLEHAKWLDQWTAEHEDIPCVWTHGIETPVMRPRSQRFDIPPEFLRCLKRPNMHLELMLQLMAPDTQYPWPWAQDMIHQFYDELGPEKLLWGSDMPAAERTCLYSQAMDYIRLHCDFLDEQDCQRILGGNAARLFNIDRTGRFRDVYESRTPPGKERVDID